MWLFLWKAVAVSAPRGVLVLNDLARRDPSLVGTVFERGNERGNG
jgi:hypothetical protein